MMIRSRFVRRLLASVAALPLLQATCTSDALASSFFVQVVNGATQFTYDVTQVILDNLFRL